MKDVREMFNISYFDNKELSLKEHCDIYSNIKKELISILNKYDIKYVLAETEVIKDLSKENQELKKQLEELEKENFNLRENIYINKISFSSEGKNIKELIEMPTYEDLINQQKEFIEYINAYIELLKDKPDLVEEGQKDILEEILSKYKKIIGGIK